MKSDIDKKIDEIDEFIMKETGVDLKKLEKRLEATRRAFRGMDLSPVTVGQDIFLIKSRWANRIH